MLTRTDRERASILWQVIPKFTAQEQLSIFNDTVSLVRQRGHSLSPLIPLRNQHYEKFSQGWAQMCTYIFLKNKVSNCIFSCPGAWDIQQGSNSQYILNILYAKQLLPSLPTFLDCINDIKIWNFNNVIQRLSQQWTSFIWVNNAILRVYILTINVILWT